MADLFVRDPGFRSAVDALYRLGPDDRAGVVAVAVKWPTLPEPVKAGIRVMVGAVAVSDVGDVGDSR